MPARLAPSSPSLLSPGGYDDDVISLRSLSDQDSDSEDDQLVQASRSTLELARHDRTVLEEEEELERLLTKDRHQGGGLKRIFGTAHDMGSSVRIGKKEKRRRKKRRAQSSINRGGDEEGELMYEMEEGDVFNKEDDGELSSLSSGSSSSSLDTLMLETRPLESKSFYRRFSLPFSAIIILFLILFLGAYKASSQFRARQHNKYTLLSNGTALFRPTTILISLDGFRADFLTRGLTPTLNQFVAEGISPRYMLPSFPSVTFPNHFTLVTGLYPESHGVVGNTFWDPKLQEDFYYTDPARSMQAKWWNAEPIWVTAEKQGVRTAIHMWPGSEAHIGPMEPTYLDKYNGSEELSAKVDRILHWLDFPGDDDEFHSAREHKRPQFIASYVPNVDADGHMFGPNSTEIRKTIANADNMLKSLFDGLQARNLTHIVNVIVVSDHGMATTSTNRLVELDNLVDLSLIERIDGWPLQGLRPRSDADIPKIIRELEKASRLYKASIEVYTRETMPKRYHFSNNDRIAPIWIIPKTGWAIVKRTDFDIEVAKTKNITYHPRGIHGYDHEHPLMRSIFVAHGPSFPHKPNSRVEPFQNIEVYNVLCDTLHIEPNPNNGTFRLPFHPVGLHSDKNAPPPDVPEDPSASSSKVNLVSTSTSSASVADAWTRPAPIAANPSPVTAPVPGNSQSIDDIKSHEDDKDDDDKNDALFWWRHIKDQIDALKEWAKGILKDPNSNIDPNSI
ncbi:Type I phosphodiesterase / nucleotide pyrophosphatase family protein [Coccidioides posadasii C735 delta SOWgp]|uniref:Ectonucleotide pyrophosphatase/phosphodiesterase 2 n=2 Tax=Coccidioides posadasii TaxID=199306 RepID=A0A0J6F4E1_COCPO|nr:Type I phosphodiesterase / nucleotide pyrophosphatase family protein [Coccidioides posadasii C735 delta SOWgp]EER28758.1 Type I phosphodiesterase / nucleotide pyrophosphatase family protein [Coccidioides posadasii C735 delta SOWgp]KMM64120.1 ectonucleotide pyrophosphatase/phosphodiesterase 2 [Coccidioides posadasii RMSCC 3488]|eukprot:XP_003070903.1 Type I phosphodiesterase / nucleotide pyrophosphatase family protein [Coccidioides posadasii C735 delta SOWgp]